MSQLEAEALKLTGTDTLPVPLGVAQPHWLAEPLSLPLRIIIVHRSGFSYFELEGSMLSRLPRGPDSELPIKSSGYRSYSM